MPIHDIWININLTCSYIFLFLYIFKEDDSSFISLNIYGNRIHTFITTTMIINVSIETIINKTK